MSERLKRKYQILFVIYETYLITKAALITETTKIENEIADTSYFINTQELNRLRKISFDAKIKEPQKNFTS